MAKYNVTFSCGHNKEVQLFGPMVERERKLAWYREHALCRACFRQELQASGPQFYVSALSDGNVLISCYANSYLIRGCLRERGYKFTRDAVSPDANPLRLRETPGWERRLPEAEAQAEIAWLIEQGWNVQVASQMAQVLNALRHGAPELLPA